MPRLNYQYIHMYICSDIWEDIYISIRTFINIYVWIYVEVCKHTCMYRYSWMYIRQYKHIRPPIPVLHTPFHAYTQIHKRKYIDKQTHMHVYIYKYPPPPPPTQNMHTNIYHKTNTAISNLIGFSSYTHLHTHTLIHRNIHQSTPYFKHTFIHHNITLP